MGTYYVSPTGTNSYASATTSAASTNLMQCTNNSAGDTIYFAPGTHTTSAVLTMVAGTIAAPTRLVGYNAAIEDLTIESSGGTWSATHSSNGFLNTANFPVLSFAGNRLTVGAYTSLEGLVITGSVNNPLLTGTTGVMVFRCSITNSNAGASGRSVQSANTIRDCDISSNGGAGLFGCRNVFGSRVKSSASSAISGNGTNAATTVENAIIYGLASGQTGIAVDSDGQPDVVRNCTFYNIPGACISVANAAITNKILHVWNNQATNCGTFCTNLRQATTKIWLFGGNNRLRNCTTNYYGFLNVTDTTGTLSGDITTAQADTQEYMDSTATPPDLRLTAAAAGKGAGMPPYLDTGALQRQESGGSRNNPSSFSGGIG